MCGTQEGNASQTVPHQAGSTTSKYTQKLSNVGRVGAERIPEFNFPKPLSIPRLWLDLDIFLSPWKRTRKSLKAGWRAWPCAWGVSLWWRVSSSLRQGLQSTQSQMRECMCACVCVCAVTVERMEIGLQGGRHLTTAQSSPWIASMSWHQPQTSAGHVVKWWISNLVVETEAKSRARIKGPFCPCCLEMTSPWIWHTPPHILCSSGEEQKSERCTTELFKEDF